jgi:hypothetical protein
LLSGLQNYIFFSHPPNIFSINTEKIFFLSPQSFCARQTISQKKRLLNRSFKLRRLKREGKDTESFLFVQEKSLKIKKFLPEDHAPALQKNNRSYT